MTAPSQGNTAGAEKRQHEATKRPLDEHRVRFGTNLAGALFTLAGGLGGYLVGALLMRDQFLNGPNNVLYLTFVGLLLAYLFTRGPARRSGRFWARSVERFARVGPDAVVAGLVGATVGLLLTILINSVLAEVPGFTWYWSILIAVVLVLGWGGYFVMNRGALPLLKNAAADPQGKDLPSGKVNDKVVDTSAIIDGRIVDVADANFVDGKLILPQFVLAELQRLADSEDPLRRQRGRRGLEVLDRLVANPHITTEVITTGVDAKLPVDDRLVNLCLDAGYDLITTDYNLSRVAGLQGLRVLNLNQLANSVKANFMPGERLSLNIVRQGREAGQGLAYLEDGTMVVVEDAADQVGHSLEAVVTSSLQTNMGRMIFARPKG
ncbi:MAG TPA: PIN domain-containing protein, partial [Trueperaceae bacterium]|nr:PIN domain-containing protein [Trueperaceae bacterium]